MKFPEDIEQIHLISFDRFPYSLIFHFLLYLLYMHVYDSHIYCRHAYFMFSLFSFILNRMSVFLFSYIKRV